MPVGGHVKRTETRAVIVIARSGFCAEAIPNAALGIASAHYASQ